MSGWLLFFLIVLVFAFVISNAIVLAKMKLPKSVMRKIEEKQIQASLAKKKKNRKSKKDQH